MIGRKKILNITQLKEKKNKLLRRDFIKYLKKIKKYKYKINLEIQFCIMVKSLSALTFIFLYIIIDFFYQSYKLFYYNFYSKKKNN